MDFLPFVLQGLLSLGLAPLWMGMVWKIKNYRRTGALDGRVLRYYRLWWDQLHLPFEETTDAPRGQYLVPPLVVTVFAILAFMTPTFFLPASTSNWPAILHGDLFLIVELLGVSFLLFMLFTDPRNPFVSKSFSKLSVNHVYTEPVLLINVMALAVVTNRTDLWGIFSALVQEFGDWTLLTHDQVTRTFPAAGIVLLSLWYCFLALCSRIPLDDLEDDAELTTGEKTPEFTVAGPDVALIQLAYAFKLSFLASLITDLVLPQTMSSSTEPLQLLGGFLFFVLKMAAFFLWLAIWETRRVKVAPPKGRESLVNSLTYALIAFLYLVIIQAYPQKGGTENPGWVLVSIQITLSILPFIMVLTALRMSSSVSIQNMVGWYKSQTAVLFVILTVTWIKLLLSSQTGATTMWQSIIFVLFLIPPLVLLLFIDFLLRLGTLPDPNGARRRPGPIRRFLKTWSYLMSADAAYLTDEVWRGLGKSQLGQIYSLFLDFGLVGMAFLVAYQITTTGLLIIQVNSLAIAIALLLIGTFTMYNKDDNILSRCLGFLMVEHGLLFIASQTVESSSEQTIPIVVVLVYIFIPLTIFLWYLPNRLRIFGNIRMMQQRRLMQ